MGVVANIVKRMAGPSPGEMVRREVVPLEGTNMSLFHSIIPSFWEANGLGSYGSSWLPSTPSLADRVWVANRCIQLNAQQIAAMPIQFFGTDEPMWVSSPDPNVFPNGVGDALHAIVAQLYKWGFSCQYVTDVYADGFPRAWTVLDSAGLQIQWKDGAREYKYGEQPLNPRRVIQIDRNPGLAAHGTPALSAYAQNAWGLLAAGNQSMTVSTGGIPQTVIKSERKLDKAQAAAIQAQWMTATGSRNGAPAVLPPELSFEQLSFNPSDLSLLETQEWNARTLATAYGVPAVILNMSLQGGLTYQNPMALMQMWWLTELRTTAKRIADSFSAQALPRGQWIAFDATDITTEGAATSDDPQASQVAKATPAQQTPRLTAIGGRP